MDTGSFPETIWDVSKTPPLDPSYVDPIWDGSQKFTSGKISPTQAKTPDYSSVNKKNRSDSSVGVYANFPMNVFATSQSEEHPIVSNDELSRTTSLKVNSPVVHRDLRKVHSTFWGGPRHGSRFSNYHDNPMTVL